MIQITSILIVEDDMMIASGLMYAFSSEGYEPKHCKTVREAYELIEKNNFGLAVLDVALPDGTGFDIAGKLTSKAIPVIFLTAVDDENKIVCAFENGAADYIVKPFRIRELLARVKRTLTEKNNPGENQLVSLGKAVIDVLAGKVYVNEEPLELTALEYKLLLIFADNPGRLLTRARILESIWDCGGNFVEDNTLTVYIKRLREKLGDAVSIETVRGLGYRVDK